MSEATGASIEALGVERGHRTLVVTRKGGKVVTIPLAPRTARAIADLSQSLGEFPRGTAGHVRLIVAGIVDDLPAVQVLRGHRGGATQYGGHDGEVASSDHAHTPVTGEAVQLLIILRGKSAGANHRVNPGPDRGPHVVLDSGGAAVIDENVCLCGLQRLSQPSICTRAAAECWGQRQRPDRDDMGVRRIGVLGFDEDRGQPTVSRAGQRAALPSSRRRAAVSTVTSGTRLGSDSTVIRSVPV